MRNELMVITILAIVVLVAAAVGGAETIDFLELDWYDVEPWEIDVCSRGFSETDMGGSDIEPGEAVSLELFSGETIMTLQAEKSEPYPDNSSLVQISWYVQPLTTSINFEVTAYYVDGRKEVLESGSSTVASGFSGYQYYILTEDQMIDKVQLYVDEGDVTMEVPVV